jgi:uncharacterized protein involved in tolerance to divalent cations
MSEFCVVYITHENATAAKALGEQLMQERLIACFNLLSHVETACFWPPKSSEFERSSEVVLLCKTISEKFDDIESFVEHAKYLK